jgi:ribose transport system permease protein
MTSAKTTGSGATGSDTPADRRDLSPQPTPAAAHRRGALSLVTPHLEKYGLLVLFVLMFVIFASVWDRPGTFRSAANLSSVLGTYAVPGVLALAAIVPLVCGQFDLTVGSVAGLTAMSTAAALTRYHLSLPVAVLIALAIGLLVGAINGYLVAFVGVNAFITTLGMASVIAGLLTLYSNGDTILIADPTLGSLGAATIVGVPRILLALGVIAVIVYYLLEHTPFGRYLHSIGSNPTAARLVGLDVRRLIMLSFILSSTLAALGGVLLVARNGNANPQLGGQLLTLPALAAAFLGATAIKPGRFNVIGTLLAVYFLAFSLSGLNLNNVSQWITDFFTGAALVAAVALSTVIGRRRARAS